MCDYVNEHWQVSTPSTSRLPNVAINWIHPLREATVRPRGGIPICPLFRLGAGSGILTIPDQIVLES